MSDKVEDRAKRSSSINRSILRLPEVIRRTGFKRTSIYRMIKKGEFPNSRKIGPRAKGWDSFEIDNWIKERLEISDFDAQ